MMERFRRHFPQKDGRSCIHAEKKITALLENMFSSVGVRLEGLESIACSGARLQNTGMCNQYRPPTPRAIADHFGVVEPSFAYPARTYKGYTAPMLRRAEGGAGMVVEEGHFGLVPFFAESTKLSYDTLNARTESIATAASYRGPWKRRQFCLVPMQAFTEPNYESGKSQWWDVLRRDGKPFAVAGLYDRWRSPEGELYWSFTLPTINSGSHPLMKQFHKPGKEKRSVVVLPRSCYDAWLDATNDDEARALFVMFDECQFDAGPVERAKVQSLF
jgi:putative SOS response-associated peptidase YedK